MTEREKLLSGLEYNSRDGELIGMYHRARALIKSLGALDSHQADEKNRLLGELFGAWGEASWIETPFWCDYGQHVRIGKNCFINVNAVFLDCNTITIGDNTLIGIKATVLNGARIGRNCLIGAHALMHVGQFVSVRRKLKKPVAI